jgi:hypothetical protein
VSGCGECRPWESPEGGPLRRRIITAGVRSHAGCRRRRRRRFARQVVMPAQAMSRAGARLPGTARRRASRGPAGNESCSTCHRPGGPGPGLEHRAVVTSSRVPRHRRLAHPERQRLPRAAQAMDAPIQRRGHVLPGERPGLVPCPGPDASNQGATGAVVQPGYRRSAVSPAHAQGAKKKAQGIAALG